MYESMNFICLAYTSNNFSKYLCPTHYYGTKLLKDDQM